MVTVVVAVLAAAPTAAGSGSAGGLTGSLRVTLSPRVIAALSAGGGNVTRSVVALAPARSPRAGVLVFPLAGRRTGGFVHSRGAVRFTVSTQAPYAVRTSAFTLSRFAVRLSGARGQLIATFAGAATYPGVAVATLSLRHRRLRGMVARLTSAGAEAFNDQANGFRAGEVVGTVTLSLSARSGDCGRRCG